MTIDVDTILTDAELDEFLGGQVEGSTTLRPVSWENCAPARQFALDEILRLLKRAGPTIEEEDITATATLKRAVCLGAASRLYELAMTSGNASEVFFALEARNRKLMNDEIRWIADEIQAARVARLALVGVDLLTDEILENKGRGRRSVVLVRR